MRTAPITRIRTWRRGVWHRFGQQRMLRPGDAVCGGAQNERGSAQRVGRRVVLSCRIQSSHKRGIRLASSVPTQSQSDRLRRSSLSSQSRSGRQRTSCYRSFGIARPVASRQRVQYRRDRRSRASAGESSLIQSGREIVKPWKTLSAVLLTITVRPLLSSPFCLQDESFLRREEPTE